MIKKRLALVIFLFIATLSIQQFYVSNKSFWQISQNEILSMEVSASNPVNHFLGLFSPSEKVNKTDLEIIPGGQSIGVTLQTKGVLVVGYAPIMDSQGKDFYPAKEAGVQIGDIILTINGIKAQNDIQVAQEIDKKCKENQRIDLEIKHKGQTVQKSVQPRYCEETQRYRVGLYIRDEAAGVGTLTFIDPKTKIFGALGHVITDIDTNDQIELSDGKIVESMIYSIEKGKRGDPGEKIGTFMLESSFSGKIEKNTNSGIFGVGEGQFKNPFYGSPIPVGWKTDVQVGPAKIYTVIKDNTIEEFEIKIEKIMHYRNDNKNMIIRVTDPKLLDCTGGIVQGMSGSPIIQNGKLIGAVTHVFVNDSTRGYGVFIEKMLHESGVTSKAATAREGGFFYLVFTLN